MISDIVLTFVGKLWLISMLKVFACQILNSFVWNLENTFLIWLFWFLIKVFILKYKGYRSAIITYSNHLNTGLVWYLNGRFVSGCQTNLLSNSLVFEWGSENRTKKTLFMVQNVRYSNGLLSQMTLPFEYRTPQLSGIQVNPVFGCLVFRWLLYRYNWHWSWPGDSLLVMWLSNQGR